MKLSVKHDNTIKNILKEFNVEFTCNAKSVVCWRAISKFWSSTQRIINADTPNGRSPNSGNEKNNCCDPDRDQTRKPSDDR